MMKNQQNEITENKSTKEYIDKLPSDRKDYFLRLLETIRKTIPTGFKEQIIFGMIGFVVPHEKYPNGYHVNPNTPLPFVNLALQKNHIAIYHMGLYSKKELLNWFREEYPKHSKYKLDIGKSCIRFKNPKSIPFDLIGELMQKMTVGEWIELYEQSINK